MCLPTNIVSCIKRDKSSCTQLFDALKSLPTLVTFILFVVRILLWKIKSYLLLDFSHTILLTDGNLTPAVTLLTSILKVPSWNLSQDTFYPDWVSIQSSSAYLSKCLMSILSYTSIFQHSFQLISSFAIIQFELQSVVICSPAKQIPQ